MYLLNVQICFFVILRSVLSFVNPRTQTYIVNIQLAIVALVLIVVSYLLNRYSKKSEAKQTPS